jgi:hypothetical protein
VRDQAVSNIMKQHILAIALAAAASPAAAYTSYLKPDEFWVSDRDVRVEGAYASQFFTPQIALGAGLIVFTPDGQRLAADRIEVSTTATTLDADLPGGGTYRISTGEQLGQVTTLVGVEGQWRVLGASEIPPEGAPTTTLQTVTLADAYVTRGAPTREVVDQPIGQLALRPVTHPNQVLAANGFEVELLFDGAPMANSAVVLYAAGDHDTSLDRYVATDAAGRARFTFDAPGQYVIAARHRADAPPGSPAAVRSYTTTLTFEALAVLPEAREIRAEEFDRSRPPPPRRRVGGRYN